MSAEQSSTTGAVFDLAPANKSKQCANSNYGSPLPMGGWGRLRVGDNSGSELSFGSLGGYVVEIIKLDKGGTDGLE